MPPMPSRPSQKPAAGRVRTPRATSSSGKVPAGVTGTAAASRQASARAHQSVRAAHANEIAEDYVEAIAELARTQGEARVVELARALGVSHVTVVRTLARLQREGLVQTRPYRAIFLTAEGGKLAEKARVRHELVEAFLLALGVPQAVAKRDAEGIEHHVSAQTLAAMERLLRRGR
jgi:DtxR family transcriptional regulator, manganese transport regulator